MLVVKGVIAKRCPKGEDCAKRVVDGKRTVDTMTGQIRVDREVPEYTDGEPFGYLQVMAPIDLLPGDVVECEGDAGIVQTVTRGDAVVYDIKAEKAEKQKART